ncbi:MAG: rhomboid family intramembrane serine protease [Planctomycetota bacterium]
MLPLFDRQPTTRFPVLTILLIVANLGVAWWSTNLREGPLLDLVFEYGFVPQRLTEAGSGKPLVFQAEVREGVFYQANLNTSPPSVYRSLVTMMFLHGGWLHVISNMWMLWIFGNNVEDRLGHVTFAAFYLLGGLLSAACQWAVDPASQAPVVGASGAVWAVLGGYAVTYPKSKIFTIVFVGVPIPMNLPALLVIAVKFGTDLMLGIQMLQGAVAEPIAHWAHVGGGAAGVLLMPLLGLGSPPTDSDWRGEAEAMLKPLTDKTSPPVKS